LGFCLRRHRALAHRAVQKADSQYAPHAGAQNSLNVNGPPTLQHSAASAREEILFNQDDEIQSLSPEG
jgi:hypothetical protein